MLKQTAGSLGASRVADVAIAAPRQLWLAGLGAAIVTREWARNDAGHAFLALVKEGSQVEARAMRIIGRRIESSARFGTTAWNAAREAARATINALVGSTATAFPHFKTSVAGKRAPKPAPRKPRAAAKRVATRKSRRGKRSA